VDMNNVGFLSDNSVEYGDSNTSTSMFIKNKYEYEYPY
jgi:hypothetical protein